MSENLAFPKDLHQCLLLIHFLMVDLLLECSKEEFAVFSPLFTRNHFEYFLYVQVLDPDSFHESLFLRFIGLNGSRQQVRYAGDLLELLLGRRGVQDREHAILLQIEGLLQLLERLFGFLAIPPFLELRHGEALSSLASSDLELLRRLLLEALHLIHDLNFQGLGGLLGN